MTPSIREAMLAAIEPLAIRPCLVQYLQSQSLHAIVRAGLLAYTTYTYVVRKLNIRPGIPNVIVVIKHIAGGKRGRPAKLDEHNRKLRKIMADFAEESFNESTTLLSGKSFCF